MPLPCPQGWSIRAALGSSEERQVPEFASKRSGGTIKAQFFGMEWDLPERITEIQDECTDSLRIGRRA